jgi:hypothetical protein
LDSGENKWIEDRLVFAMAAHIVAARSNASATNKIEDFINIIDNLKVVTYGREIYRSEGISSSFGLWKAVALRVAPRTDRRAPSPEVTSKVTRDQ